MYILKCLILAVNILCITSIPAPEPLEDDVINLKECSPEDMLEAQQRCDPFMEEVDGYMDEYDGDVPSEDVMNNMTELFEKVSNCYSGFKCKQAVEYSQKLNQEFRDQKIANTGINSCMLGLYGAAFEGTYNCTNGYDWFSQNATVKRDAFISGKSCFLEIAMDECMNSTIQYLNTDYDSFVDVITIQPEGPKCKGLYYELNDLKCNQPIETMMMQSMKFLTKIMPDEEQKKEEHKEIYEFFEQDKTNMTLICMVLSDCMENSCSFPKGMQSLAEKTCKELKKVNNVNGDFFQCMYKLDRFNTTKHTCLPDYTMTSTTPNPSKSFLTRVGKDCAMSVMKEECPESTMVNFDEHWNYAVKILEKDSNANLTLPEIVSLDTEQ